MTDDPKSAAVSFAFFVVFGFGPPSTLSTIGRAPKITKQALVAEQNVTHFWQSHEFLGDTVGTCAGFFVLDEGYGSWPFFFPLPFCLAAHAICLLYDRDVLFVHGILPRLRCLPRGDFLGVLAPLALGTGVASYMRRRQR
eukprot:tig00000552_g2057.t1